MGMVQLPDELQRVIERQVVAGRAASPAAFLEDAVMQLMDEARGEEDERLQVVETGAAAIAAGRYTTVATSEDERHVQDGMLERLRARLSNGG